MTKETPQSRYNRKRVRLCEFAVTAEEAEIVGPAFERLVKHYGSKVSALTHAVLDADKKLSKKK